MTKKITLALSLTLLVLAFCALYWYQSQPKPEELSAMVSPPSITPNAQNSTPSNLFVDFGIHNPGFTPQPVAPLSEVQKPITQGISLTPTLKGQWSWNNDSQLLFIPEEDWPA
jgi:hypothetical protein